ncbi:MAG: hypothetical protein GX595_08470 [Lentisphaerae bacterium]|nr:hypothetical protein [Lentisphaerota bacterium]
MVHVDGERSIRASRVVQVGRPPSQRERPWPKTGRNEPCPCGSGRKYKHFYPKGIASSSPGLRQSRYPGSRFHPAHPTPTWVASWCRCAVPWRSDRRNPRWGSGHGHDPSQGSGGTATLGSWTQPPWGMGGQTPSATLPVLETTVLHTKSGKRRLNAVW